VVGDAEVVEAQVLGGLGHFFESVPTIGGGGMRVDGAFKVAELNEAGDFIVFGGFDFASIFTECSGDGLESEVGVDFRSLG